MNKILKINSEFVCKQKGFTLIEVVLAMMIMTVGLSIMATSWNSTYTRLRKTQIQVQLASLLERKVVEIERENKNTSIDNYPESKEDDFGTELPGYSWKMESQKFNLPNLAGIIGGSEDNTLATIFKLFSEHLNKTVLEVKITVFFKDKKKKYEASVVIYKIDYDRPLPIPGVGS